MRDFIDTNGDVLTEGDTVEVHSEFYGKFKTELIVKHGCLGYEEYNCESVENPDSWKEKGHSYDMTKSGWFGSGFKPVVGGYSKLNGKNVKLYKQ